ncbi:hypothetical protein ZWY2020_040841 [Hordeum vulgare]|nr:hypothetical protein ZWY2020_040841 [Hordeum vulgare]
MAGPALPSLRFLLRGKRGSAWILLTPFAQSPPAGVIHHGVGVARDPPLQGLALHAAASRFRPLAAAGSLLLAALVPSPAAAPWAAARRFATKPASAHHSHSWRNGRHPSW